MGGQDFRQIKKKNWTMGEAYIDGIDMADISMFFVILLSSYLKCLMKVQNSNAMK